MKKRHWLILLALVVLTGVYFIARSRQPVEKDIRFFQADSAAIARLEFFSTEDTILIEKRGKDWKLVYPLYWDASEQQMNTFFSKVLPMRTSATPMSEDPGLQSLYKVDSLSAIQVIVRDKSGKILDHAYIGNGTDTSYDYGRKQGDNRIYQFKDNLTNLIRPDIFQWRSPNIINLKRDQIQSINVTYTKNSYTLKMDGDSLRYSDSSEKFTVPPYNRAQYKIINALENLMTWQFVDKNTGLYAADFKTPACTIVLHLKDGQTRTLTLISKVEPGQPVQPGEPDQNILVLLKLDAQPSPLYQMSADFLNRFTRAAAHFKAEYE
jgi:hypothetical protein